MDIYRELICYRFALIKIILNKKNISNKEYTFIKKSLLNIKDMCSKLKNKENFNYIDQTTEIKKFILSKNRKKVGK